MSPIKENFVPSSVYNALPYVADADHAAEESADDLNHLRTLLRDHHVPDALSIRLRAPSQGLPLRGLHLFVDTDSLIQAYEYTIEEVVDMTKYEDFIREFCRFITGRGLQRVSGLQFSANQEDSYREYEFPSKRSTIMIPAGMVVPENSHELSEVITEWDKAKEGFRKFGCTHCKHQRTCKHPTANCGQGAASGFTLSGHTVDPKSPVFAIMRAVAAAW
jgi:hypothetical protein